jgi:hypothetical protein
MKLILLFLNLHFSTLLVAQVSQLPLWHEKKNLSTRTDWITKPVMEKAALYTTGNGKDIVMYNGLVKRIFRITPNIVCYDYSNLMNGQQLLRAVREEARLNIDGKEFAVGGLHGQKEKAYLLNEWVDQWTADKNDFQFVSYSTGVITADLPIQKKFWSTANQPAAGVTIDFLYRHKDLTGLDVHVWYALYDAMPVIQKWVTIENKSGKAYKISRVVNEVLALVEEESAVVGKPEQMKKPQGIYFETNYAFNNAMRYDISDQTTHWKTDSSYTSQVNYYYETPCVLEVYPDKAPGITLNAGEQFTSVKTWELLMDSYDRERRGLAVRKMYRAIAPWTNSNPIFMHLVSKNDQQVKEAIDQCYATGYEALILSFGSHIDMEDTTVENLRRWKMLADYAHSKKIFIGGYSLFSSRKISEEDDVISPLTGKTGGAFFGNAPCFGSKWGIAYAAKIKNFYAFTGFDIWENDGPYPGDQCASTTHPGHKGLDDSQWRQMEMQKGLYRWLNARGVYINAPDWYFLDGTHKIAIGYREVNFSLSREQQKIINRQNIFDGTWEKTPSMGWGFVPLTRYQGGGPEAVLEPLSEHLKDYEQLMVQYYGAGVQACYRGPRLYDTEETKALVVRVISWYKKYRDILNSDVIHLRRADGRDWDGIMHANPALSIKGFVLLYNPLKEKISRTIQLPLQYTGLTAKLRVKEKDTRIVTPVVNNGNLTLSFTIEPESYTWFTLE